VSTDKQVTEPTTSDMWVAFERAANVGETIVKLSKWVIGAAVIGSVSVTTYVVNDLTDRQLTRQAVQNINVTLDANGQKIEEIREVVVGDVRTRLVAVERAIQPGVLPVAREATAELRREIDVLKTELQAKGVISEE